MASFSQILVVCTTLILVGNVQVNLASAVKAFHLGLNGDGSSRATKLTYPAVRRNESVITDYHGTNISDPYRYLEELDSVETKAFVVAQQKFTKEYMDKITSRDAIRKRLTEVWNYPKSTAPQKVGTKYYTFQNTGLQNQSIMYVQDGLDKNATVFLDPNTLSKDGTIALDSYSFSKDGNIFAYATAESGSDWKKIHFKNVTSKTDLTDTLEFSKWPSMSWSHDNKGIFFSRYPNGTGLAKDSVIYYHKIGTPQSEDIQIINFPSFPDRILYCEVSDDGKYLIVGGEESYNANSIHIGSLAEGIDKNLAGRIKPLFGNATEAAYMYITNNGPEFIFQTNKDAPNYKLAKVNSSSTTPSLTTLLAENANNSINWVSVVATDKLVVSYLENVKSTVELRKLSDASLIQKFVNLPDGSISGITHSGREDSEFFFNLESFLAPGTIYRGIVNGGNATYSIFKETKVQGLNLSDFIQEQKFYPSKDGTSVPMYIIRHKSVVLNGSAPTLLYAYGGFNLASLPTFAARNLAFVEGFTGIYVLANIRGGSEFGEKWHEGGMLFKKQNVFDDFHAAAEYLIKNKYTSSSKLTIHGRSNGGLLIGACVNQRPDLYATGLAQVGVMDMLRFQEFTSGSAWCPEYGCSNNKAEFENLIKYSPLHNLRFAASNVTYPAVLVTTGDHDERVVPSHSFKYTAELQRTIGQDARQTKPLLLRVDVDAGHGGGKPVAKEIEEFVDMWAFVGETQSLTFKVPGGEVNQTTTTTPNPTNTTTTTLSPTNKPSTTQSPTEETTSSSSNLSLNVLLVTLMAFTMKAFY